MLIATESDASFVINGIIFKEQENSFVNLKIYEAKRGSLIVNQKVSLNSSKKVFLILFLSLLTIFPLNRFCGGERGIEPSIRLLAYTRSRRAPSTARPPLLYYSNYSFLI